MNEAAWLSELKLRGRNCRLAPELSAQLWACRLGSPITAMCFDIGGLHEAAEKAAINLSYLAFAAEHAALQFSRNGSAQPVRKDECGLETGSSSCR
jgi:hypothetical protein